MDVLSAAQQNIEQLYQFFETSDKGLASQQVKVLQQRYGLNQRNQNIKSAMHILLNQIKSPFIYLLCIASLLSFILGDVVEGCLILFFIIFNIALGFYQEYNAEQTIALLQRYLTLHAKVLRDGVVKLIESKYLVPGDIVIVEPGDTIPADVRFIDDNAVSVDESIITGESVPVVKTGRTAEHEIKELFAAKNIGFSGTTVTSGKGHALVIATGYNTVIGQVATLSGSVMRESNFSKQIAAFSTFIIILIISTLALVFCLQLLLKGTAHIGQLLIFCIALAVTITPELLPLVITFSLSRGALRLAHQSVIVKRLSAIEDLGSIDILCSDKTGTLTENVLVVEDIYSADAQKTLLYALIAAGQENNNHGRVQYYNPFDQAIRSALHSAQDLQQVSTYKKLFELPFDPERLRNDIVVEKDNEKILIVRGAFEIMQKHLKQESFSKEAIDWVLAKGKDAKRVLAIAYKIIPPQSPLEQEVNDERDLQLLGLISFVDPIKPSVSKAVEKARQLGVALKILTGDASEVAGSVAYTIGLINDANKVMTGLQWNDMNLEDRKKCVQQYHVFARVNPKQKYEIIQLLQEHNRVGYLGEGINDAPALKIADVALVVQGASDIAREAADIVLLKKSLNVIIEGIYQGRLVFANTVKYIKSILSSNLGNFYSVAIASLFIDFLPMLPLQILLVNIISDIPMLTISIDTVDISELQKPRVYNIHEFLTFAVMLGLISSFFDMLLFLKFYRLTPSTLQTAWFVESIFTELVLIYSIRTRQLFFKARFPSLALIGCSVVSMIITLTLAYTSLGQRLFGFSSLSIEYIYFIIVLVLGYFVATEIFKVLYYKIVKL